MSGRNGTETKNRGNRPHHRSKYWMVTGGFDIDAGFGFAGGLWYFDFWNLQEDLIHGYSFTGVGVSAEFNFWSKIGQALKLSSKAAREATEYAEGIKYIRDKIAYEGIEKAYEVASAGAWYKVDSIVTGSGLLSDVDISNAFGFISSAGAALHVGRKLLILSVEDALKRQECHGFSAGMGLQLISMAGKWIHEDTRPAKSVVPKPKPLLPPSSVSAGKGRMTQNARAPRRRN